MQKSVRFGFTFDDVLLVPKKTSLISRREVDLTSHLTSKISLSFPIISANMDSVTESTMAIAMAEAGGMGFIHRFLTIEDEVEQVRKVKAQGLSVGAAIGVKDDYLERARALVENGCDVLVIDIAHGHSIQLLAALESLKKSLPDAQIVAGNIATGQAARDLINAGADCVKVGIGPGAFCTTRLVTGAGVPQLTAIMDVVEVAREFNIPVIADGGIRTSGDIVKALAAGASTVMFGTMFAGTDETPMPIIEKDGQKFKHARGMASLSANRDRKIHDTTVRIDEDSYTPEGVERLVPYSGSVVPILQKLAGGIRSGFSYCGAHTVSELWENAEFMQVTSSTIAESMPHEVTVS